MGSLPPPGLNGPPPNPAAGPPPGGPGAMGPPGMGGPGGPPPPDQQVKGLLQMGAQMDQAFLAISQAGPEGAKEFDAARKLLQVGLAKVIQAKSPGAVATSPTEAGASFTGGGFGSTGGI